MFHFRNKESFKFFCPVPKLIVKHDLIPNIEIGIKNVLSISGSFDIWLEGYSKKHRSFKYNSFNTLYAYTLQSITILYQI